MPRTVEVLVLFSSVAVAVWIGACGSSGAPGVDDCSNLREIHASGSVEGEFASLEEFDFSFSGSGDYTVIPPDGSDCATDIAVRLEAACRVCDKDPNSCESTVENVLSQPTQACTTCGDDICGGDESPANCPQDCADACGNGTCEGTENFQSCPVDCSGGAACGNQTCEPGENPVNCPEDCATACGNGTCDGDESRQSCPEDCTEPCGDGTCGQGETPTNCPTDCAQTACGNDECEPGENQVLCPADCGGCSPNSCQCMGNVVVTCNADGVSSSFRQCGGDNECRQCSCRSIDPVTGQEEVEETVLGNWRVTVLLYDDNDTDRRVAIGNAIYLLEIFELEPPSAQFGIWTWRGALKPDSLCLLDNDGFDAGDGACTPWNQTRMGGCSGANCEDVDEVRASGTYSTVDGEFVMHHSSDTKGDMFHLDGTGWIEVDFNMSVESTLLSDQVAEASCPGSCMMTVNRGGAYEGEYPRYDSGDWAISLAKLSN